MRNNDAIFIVAVIAVALIFGAVTLSRAGEALSALRESAVPAGAGGQPRAVDAGRMKSLIEEKRLSGHEADFYKPLPQ